jgi:hypothetical protein
MLLHFQRLLQGLLVLQLQLLHELFTLQNFVVAAAAVQLMCMGLTKHKISGREDAKKKYILCVSE